MTITHTLEDNKLTIKVAGRLDTITAPELEAYINNYIDGIKELVFDLKDMEYTSSAGLRVFLITSKKMAHQGEMIVENVCSDVMEVFEITGFSDFLTIR